VASPNGFDAPCIATRGFFVWLLEFNITLHCLAHVAIFDQNCFSHNSTVFSPFTLCHLRSQDERRRLPSQRPPAHLSRSIQTHPSQRRHQSRLPTQHMPRPKLKTRTEIKKATLPLIHGTRRQHLSPRMMPYQRKPVMQEANVGCPGRTVIS